jgi:hypothetical protein
MKYFFHRKYIFKILKFTIIIRTIKVTICIVISMLPFRKRIIHYLQ